MSLDEAVSNDNVIANPFEAWTEKTLREQMNHISYSLFDPLLHKIVSCQSSREIIVENNKIPLSKSFFNNSERLSLCHAAGHLVANLRLLEARRLQVIAKTSIFAHQLADSFPDAKASPKEPKSVISARRALLEERIKQESVILKETKKSIVDREKELAKLGKEVDEMNLALAYSNLERRQSTAFKKFLDTYVVKDPFVFIGSAVKKKFGRNYFFGLIIKYDPIEKLYLTVYEDGDKDENDFKDLKDIFVNSRDVPQKVLFSCYSLAKNMKLVNPSEEPWSIFEYQMREDKGTKITKWRNHVRSLLSMHYSVSDSFNPMISMKEAEEILGDPLIPNDCEEKLQLQSKVEQAYKTNHILQILNSSFKRGKSNKVILWTDWLAAVKSVKLSLPIRCQGVKLLLDMYLCMDTWCERWLKPIFDFAQNEESRKDCALVDSLQSIVKLYAQAPRISISLDYFAASDALEKIFSSSNDFSEKGDNPAGSEEGEEVEEEKEEEKEEVVVGELSFSLNESFSNHDLQICVSCQLSYSAELIGESAVCPVCLARSALPGAFALSPFIPSSNSFIPFPIGAKRVEEREVGNSRHSKGNKRFRNELEVSSDDCVSISGDTASGTITRNRPIINFINLANDEGVVKEVVKDRSVEESREIYHLIMKYNAVEVSDSDSYSDSDCDDDSADEGAAAEISPEYIECAIAESLKLPILQSPVAKGLLRLQTIVKDWQGKVRTFLNSDRVAAAMHYIDKSLTRKTDQPSDETDLQELMQEAIRLLFHLRPLHIQCERTLLQLNQILWIFSIWRLVLRLKCMLDTDKAGLESDDFCWKSIVANQEKTDQVARMTFAEMRRVAHTGTLLFSQKGGPFEKIGARCLSTITRLYVQGEKLGKQARECLHIKEAEKLLLKIEGLQRVIDLDQEDFLRHVHSLVLLKSTNSDQDTPSTKKKRKRKSNQSSNEAELNVDEVIYEVEGDDRRIYCICNDVAHGKMIECENPKCKIAWFHYRCMGLTSAPRGRWVCDSCSSLGK